MKDTIDNADNRTAFCARCRATVTATQWQRCRQCDNCSWPPGGQETVHPEPTTDPGRIELKMFER